MTIDPEVLLAMLGSVERGEADSFEYRDADWRIVVSRPGAARAVSTVPESGQPVRIEMPVQADDATLVCAPMAGTFFRAPAPGKPPFFEEGQVVGDDDTIGLVEVMKLYTSVRTSRPARLIRFLAQDAVPVSAGQPLVQVEWL